MAARKRKKKKPLVRFELTLLGLVGLGVVCFCIFLWMFLLGIWVGQSVLQSAAADPVGVPAVVRSVRSCPGMVSAPSAGPATLDRHRAPEYSGCRLPPLFYLCLQMKEPTRTLGITGC
ncbi:MAG: hypothetical protein L3J03_03050 [Desulfobacterales bacterium]|nr:hypothetical protein [Desulfobacterales bacterium]